LETANALQLAGNPADASVLYSQVAKVGSPTPDPLAVAILNNWGTAQISEGNFDVAKETLSKSLAISSNKGSASLDVSTTSLNMAFIAQHEGDSEAAASLQQKSQVIRSAKEVKGAYPAWGGATQTDEVFKASQKIRSSDASYAAAKAADSAARAADSAADRAARAAEHAARAADHADHAARDAEHAGHADHAEKPDN
jgi:hypothetical protein